MILPVPDFIIILRLTLSIIAIFLSLGIGLSVLSKKSWHHYFKTAFFLFLLAFTCNAASTVFVDVICLANFEKSILFEDNFLKYLYDKGREAQRGCTCVAKGCLWCIIAERTISTIKRKGYELNCNYFLASLFFLIPFIYGCIVIVFSITIPSFSVVYYRLSSLLDILIALLSIYLLYINYRYRREAKVKRIDLSEKFQISENIRLIKFCIPIIMVNVFANFLTYILLETIFLDYISSERLIFYTFFVVISSYNMFLLNLWYQNNSCLEKKASCTVEVISRNDMFNANKLNHRKKKMVTK